MTKHGEAMQEKTLDQTAVPRGTSKAVPNAASGALPNEGAREYVVDAQKQGDGAATREQKAAQTQQASATQWAADKKTYGKPHKTHQGKVALRLLAMLFGFYPGILLIVALCLLFTAVVQALPAIFLERSLSIIGRWWKTGNWAAAAPQITRLVLILIALYIVGIFTSFVWSRLMARVSQGTLFKLRKRMFKHMESLPLRYFDTNYHGAIMSHYTNDVDALRQMISVSLPNLFITVIIMLTVLAIMLYYSIYLAVVVILGALVMMVLTHVFGGQSAQFYIQQQKLLGKTEGIAQEIMSGQRVVKVFNHEAEVKELFAAANQELFEASRAANRFTNMLWPVLLNLGNLLYVLDAVVGGYLLITGAANLSFSGLPLTIAVVIPFLNMTRQFVGQIGQMGQQINAVVMGLAGAERIFQLLDQAPEQDDGYVSLVNVKKDDNGKLTECSERTASWAWKWPHRESGITEYVPLKGKVSLHDVDFSYTPGQLILHNISLFAKPGQKIAFVGATGAGKTTITNLLTRFYDLADGKIRYDDINVTKIRKSDLRRSLGMVLQDTNLFTGSVMDNIRYGRLDASDTDCISAARLAGAHNFIQRLPQGYDTILSDNGSNLSQGQRQLLSIARAAVADPPVMILDEATSSIDTRTEKVVQEGMDALMAGRTTFVIAHRLSTVRNADLIVVLDHGRIIEKGNHNELLSQKGIYYQLYTGAFELE